MTPTDRAARLRREAYDLIALSDEIREAILTQDWATVEDLCSDRLTTLASHMARDAGALHRASISPATSASA